MHHTVLLIFTLIFCVVASSAQAQLTPAIAKRIANNTPRPLPQTDKPSKSKSDLEDKNVRGRAKNIIEEREYFDETGSSEGRHFRSIIDYNNRGDRTKAVYFGDNGFPYEVSMFGYLDGARVNHFTTIYEDSGIIVGGAIAGDEPQMGGKPDPRYNYKYVYQYSSGKLVSQQTFHSDGTKWLSYVYHRTGNQIEELIYSSNGKLNQKYITVLDSKGDEIERRDIAVINLPRADRIFRIVTDTKDGHGNWTKRTFFKVESGSAQKLPYRIEYRTITYFPVKPTASGKTKH